MRSGSVTRLCTLSTEDEQTPLLRLYAMPLAADLPRGSAKRYAHLHALELLSSALAEDWSLPHCCLERDANGKPRLLHPKLFVNLTHCRGLAVCAVATAPVGVDAEAPRPIRDRTIARVCSAKEQQALAQSPMPAFDFLRLWTLKEAYAKCVGEGIRLPFAQLSFAYDAKAIRFTHPKAEQYSFLQMILAENTTVPYAVAVCIQNLPAPCRIITEWESEIAYSDSLYWKKGGSADAEY